MIKLRIFLYYSSLSLSLPPLLSLSPFSPSSPLQFTSQILLLIQSAELHSFHDQVCLVLKTLCDKLYREDNNEQFSLKLHLLWYTVKESSSRGTDELLKRWRRERESKKKWGWEWIHIRNTMYYCVLIHW